MGFRKPEKCGKGDISVCEILIERSSPKDGATISLWKKQDDEFEVASYDEKKRGKKWHNVYPHKKYENEAEAREWYENYCCDNGYLPYPEAEAYYRRKGLLKAQV